MQAAVVDPKSLGDAERLRRFGQELDAIKARVEAEVGEEDLAYIRKVDRFSRTMEVLGRVLIHVSPEPITFGAGVVALWIHKQLQATEVGHTVLHGAYDRLENRGRFDSKKWWWQVPIDEERTEGEHDQCGRGGDDPTGEPGGMNGIGDGDTGLRHQRHATHRCEVQGTDRQHQQQ